jgi:hypothetical protein
MLLNILIVVYWVGVLILLISEDRDATATLAWILVLFALPFFGLLVYFFFGRNWPRIIQRAPVTKRLQGIIDRFMPGVYAPYADQSREFTDRLGTGFEGRIARVIEQKVGAPPLPVRTCEVYGSGAEYFDVLIADLASAERFIHMQYFIWKQDELTARITKVLLERLAAGVEVRILNDFIGNVQYRKDEMKALKVAGALIGSDIAQLSRANYSNHRKITVVDGEIGHTGGFNIGQEYIDGGKRFPAWRDTGLRMTGPGVADLEKLFDMRWYEAQGEDLFDMRYYPDPTLPNGDIMVQTVHHGYDDRWKSATRAYQVAMSGCTRAHHAAVPLFRARPEHSRRAHQRRSCGCAGGLHDHRNARQEGAVLGRRVVLRADTGGRRSHLDLGEGFLPRQGAHHRRRSLLDRYSQHGHAQPLHQQGIDGVVVGPTRGCRLQAALRGGSTGVSRAHPRRGSRVGIRQAFQELSCAVAVEPALAGVVTPTGCATL